MFDSIRYSEFLNMTLIPIGDGSDFCYEVDWYNGQVNIGNGFYCMSANHKVF